MKPFLSTEDLEDLRLLCLKDNLKRLSVLTLKRVTPIEPEFDAHFPGTVITRDNSQVLRGYEGTEILLVLSKVIVLVEVVMKQLHRERIDTVRSTLRHDCILHKSLLRMRHRLFTSAIKTLASADSEYG